MNLGSGFHQLCIYTANETKSSLKRHLPATGRNRLEAEALRLICDLFYRKKSSKPCDENALYVMRYAVIKGSRKESCLSFEFLTDG